MVDTLEIRLHNLTLHSSVEQLLFNDGYTGKTKSVYYSSLEDKMMSGTALRQIIIESKEYDYQTNLMHWSDLHVKSSHYDVKFAINYERDFIVFNVSVPKYLYGSNICQFVKSPGNPGFIFGWHKQMEAQAKELLDRINKFILYFFKNEFVDIKIHKWCIEIRRLDICYNQIFETKRHALDYLELQKRIIKNRVQDRSNYYRTYDTSVGYRTGSYYFKIYHKGTEYEKNDKKHHLKMNQIIMKSQGFNYKLDKESLKKQKDTNYTGLIDTDFLQNLSDRILRYEISFTSDRMSELYNRHEYRKDSKLFNLDRAHYLKQHARLQREKSMLTWTKEEKQQYKKFQSFIDKRRSFFPFPLHPIIEDYKKDAQNTDVRKEAYFSPGLLKLMLKDFFSLFKQYQIEALPNNDQIINKIKAHNSEIKFWNEKEKEEALIWRRKPKLKHEMNLNRMLLLMNLLEKRTIDEIKKEKLFPKATLYRYIADLAKLDVKRNHISEFSEITTSTDFQQYYDICFTYPYKMYINPESYNYF